MPSNNTSHMMTILKEFPLFAQLADPHLADLARAARSSTMQRDQALFRVGDPVGELYLLVSGQVKLALSCDRGTETIIDIVDAGRTLGEAELFGRRPSRTNAIATKPSRILGIAQDFVFQLMAADHRIALRLIRLQAQRQVDMEIELATRQTRSAPQRLLAYLLRQAGPGRGPTGETVVTLDISKQLLAARFGMQPESLSRTLRSLAATGLIEVDRGHIRLKNALIERHLAEEVAAQAMAGRGQTGQLAAITRGTAALAPTRRPSRAGSESRSLCDSINQAGRQRMLSQRMAKSWLMLERGVLSRRSRVVLRQSVAMFDHNLRELGHIADSSEIRSAHADLSAAWHPYQSLIEGDPGRKAARELFRVNEEVLRAAQQLTLVLTDADGTRKAQLINLAGRERMLSQRMAKFFLFGRMGIQSAKCRTGIEAAKEEFAASLAEFATAVPDAPAISGELEIVESHWNHMCSLLNGNDKSSFRVAATQVFTTSEHLLRHMDNAVSLYLKLPGTEITRH